MEIIKASTPSADGFRMPAEFEPHQGCILIFPERADSWQYGGYAARRAFAEVAEAIARSEQVTVCASGAQYDNARALLPAHIRVVEMSSNDAWARDYAPTFVKNDTGVIRGIDWGFNAWGGLHDGLYFPWDKDDQMARKLCDLLGKDVYCKRDFILEGGSIHVDGEGTCMVTESCLLSGGRNPALSREEIEEVLRAYLNVSKILWLPRGIYNDETNEHVDNICAFTAPGEVVLAWTEDRTDVQYAMSRACLDYLEQALDACRDQPTRTAGERLAASYVNFYIANGSIVMPGFGDPADQAAKEILQGLFPDREVVQIYARDILIGGGNIHCITQQVPV